MLIESSDVHKWNSIHDAGGSSFGFGCAGAAGFVAGAACRTADSELAVIFGCTRSLRLLTVFGFAFFAAGSVAAAPSAALHTPQTVQT